MLKKWANRKSTGCHKWNREVRQNVAGDRQMEGSLGFLYDSRGEFTLLEAHLYNEWPSIYARTHTTIVIALGVSEADGILSISESPTLGQRAIHT